MERPEFDHTLHTGLEESMHQLGLGGVGGGGGELLYPERPGEPDCIYYMRNGSCGYGVRCRFNHPLDRAGMGYGGVRAGGGDLPERAGQPVCQHYFRTGACKFGSSCKYHHPRDGSAAAVSLNHYGYPLRPGEKECSYYMKNGQCKFGLTCKFHHPQSTNALAPAAASTPAAVQGPSAVNQSVMYPTIPHHAVPTHQFGGVGGSWQVARPPMVPSSYIQGPYGPMLFPGGVVPVAGWSPYTASVSALPPPSAQTNAGAGQLYGMPPMSPAVPVYYGTYSPISSSAGPTSSTQIEPSHPERPGQPECQHYLRTGECKYGSFCRYSHPAEWSSHSQKASFALTPMGLPLRPDAPTCIYFMQRGVCRFGPTCKFNHPMGSLSYSPSASSLSDMPVAPYPVGSQTATLAPSTSSSDLRIDAISGSKDSHTETSSSPSIPGSASGQRR